MLDAIADVLSRMAPILAFLVAVTVLAELADRAQVFEVAGRQAARVARGRTPVLFVLVALLATGTTVLLGLDTTAVLLTPVVLSMATRLELAVLPFAVLTVWLANTASLLLPVSNLTNLLAVSRLELEPHELANQMWLPSLVAVLATVLVLATRFRRELRGRFVVPPTEPVADRVLFVAAGFACLGLVPALLLGGDPALVVVVAALGLVVTFAWRRRADLSLQLIPWRLTLLVAGLAVAVEAARRIGLDRAAATLAGHGSTGTDLFQIAGAGAAASNVLNNLPAYLVLEPEAARGDPDRLLALLIGTNVGPLVLIWGSLATLLWRERCRARGIHVSGWQFAALGLVGMPIVLAATTAALYLS